MAAKGVYRKNWDIEHQSGTWNDTGMMSQIP